MPSLQVRDLPEDVYLRLQQRAAAEHRSIAQETIVLLRSALDVPASRRAERRALLERISARDIQVPDGAPDPVVLVREDRDR